MPEDLRDWGPVMALMANLFHFKPWDVARLTPVQLQMYLAQSGGVRLMQALPALQANFAQLDEEARQKLIADADKPPDPESLDARAWRVFIRSYQTDSEEAEKIVTAQALPISQGAAAAFVNMVETGELTRLTIGSLLWRLTVSPIWARLLVTADGPR